ncbi:hypothetical protein MNV49_001897 [Pseudohyphozyma bogoriensis]|nr:hypothetical protein MNV49_001897 [Pseudohyphozyma bogoriensis]
MSSISSAPKYPSTQSPPGVADRNISPLLPIISTYLSLPTTSTILELASGDGTHITHYARAFPALSFWPTEADEYGCAKVDERVRGVEGVRKARVLDVFDENGWEGVKSALEGTKVDLVVAANCLHMMPFPEAARAIFAHLSDPAFVDQAHGKWCVYGPFRSRDRFFSDSDEQFDAMIRARPNGERLGLRSIEELEELAGEVGWELKDKVAMPKGNFVLVWGRK